MTRAIVLDRSDNVATLVDPGKNGESTSLRGNGSGCVVLACDIPFGHKVAIRPISRGETILKYGKVIGRATASIRSGEHVHVHNVEALRGRGDAKDGS
jgi:altronate dehydratase small subunit